MTKNFILNKKKVKKGGGINLISRYGVPPQKKLYDERDRKEKIIAKCHFALINKKKVKRGGDKFNITLRRSPPKPISNRE